MAKVDGKGRIVLPKEVRECLGITPGTQVEVRTEGGRAVVEPEDDPERVIDRMERLVREASGNRRPSDDDTHPLAEKHAERVRRGAQRGRDDDG